MRAEHELSEILDLYGDEFRQHENLPLYKLNVLRSIQYCRTTYFGGHVDKCDDCGHIRISYNSCSNPHRRKIFISGKGNERSLQGKVCRRFA